MTNQEMVAGAAASKLISKKIAAMAFKALIREAAALNSTGKKKKRA